MGKRNKTIPYEIVNGKDYIWKTPTKIETVEAFSNTCPHCTTSLVDGFTLVSVGNDNKAKVPGLKCGKCGVLFVTRSKSIRNLLQDNICAKNITLNGDSLWNYSEIIKKEKQREKFLKKLAQKREILSRINGRIMLVTLKSKGEKRDYVITNCREPQQYPNVRIIHYSNLLARELLTSIYHSKRNIKIEDKEFKVEGKYYPSNSKGEVFPSELMPSEIRIKSGGGYYESIKTNHEEVVDVLLYSPLTKRYEIAHATYNHFENECFMDVGIFRSFLHKYGRPETRINIGEPFFSGWNFDKLRSESVLHAYGYYVAEKDGLTESQRHELLAEMVDLQLLTVSHIVYLLDFFVKTHTSDVYYYARDKWERDKNYISNYKVSPNRFLFAKYMDKNTKEKVF